MTRSLLNEFARCPKSFVMSLFWHGLDNETLAQKGGVLPDKEPEYNARRDMICGNVEIADAIEMSNVIQIDCAGQGMQEKVDQTWAAINSGRHTVVYDGALEGGPFVIPFSILIVRSDGLWDVFHQSTKTLDWEEGVNEETLEPEIFPTKKTLSDALSDAAPLMYVLSRYYPDNVARFAVLGANKQYVMPYPDPRTGEITVDPNEAIYWLELDYTDVDWEKYLGSNDPMADVLEMQEQLSRNPFWIPEADIGSQCGPSAFGYDCPFKIYCSRLKEEASPNHLKFNVPYHDFNRLTKLGFETLDDMIELTYMYPTGERIPKVDRETLELIDKGVYQAEFVAEGTQKEDKYGHPMYDIYGEPVVWKKDFFYILSEHGAQLDKVDSFDISVDAMREMRAYEDMLANVEAEVGDFLS